MPSVMVRTRMKEWCRKNGEFKFKGSQNLSQIAEILSTSSYYCPDRSVPTRSSMKSFARLCLLLSAASATPISIEWYGYAS